MKAVGIIMLWLALSARGDRVWLEWDACPDPRLAAYRLYYGTNSRTYGWATNMAKGTSNLLLTLPARGTWFFTLTGRESNGWETAYGNELVLVTTPEPPQLNGEAWVALRPVIERSANLAAWVSVTGAATWVRATNAQEFFRTRQLTIERAVGVTTQP